MPKASKQKGTLRNGVFISLDEITVARLRKQAARRHGTTTGYEQDYIRAAVMKQLEKDEADQARAEAEAPAPEAA